MNPFKPHLTYSEVNTALCDAGQQAELTRVAVRPPAGMVLCKYGSRSVVGTIAVGNRQAVLKYYYPRNWLKQLTYGLVGSRARRSWKTGLELLRLGVATAEPLAFFEWKSLGGWVLDRSFLAMRHVEGTDLKTFARSHPEDTVRLTAVAANLRSAFAVMTRNRVAHGDLKATNIIVGEDHSVTFIDLDATTIHASPSAWPGLRARDEALFFDNWKRQPCAAEAFRDVFKPIA
ncbi:MAG: Protein kinaselike [Rariglobus sp.]|jgi:tRNA A-37 threonylcarbamoyl transferase component Bud32|nr:Protein kinaselike [Rariglobus sp.]